MALQPIELVCAELLLLLLLLVLLMLVLLLHIRMKVIAGSIIRGLCVLMRCNRSRHQRRLEFAKLSVRSTAASTIPRSTRWVVRHGRENDAQLNQATTWRKEAGLDDDPNDVTRP